MTIAELTRVTSESFCYLTTTGRRRGRDHTIEIWFATDGDVVFMISGGSDGSDWVRNLQADAQCRIRIADVRLDATARLPLADGPERDRAVELLHAKYATQVSSSAARWRHDGFIVAFDLASAPAD